MFVGEMAYARYCLQILADKCTQDTRTCPMKDAYAGHSHQNGIIYEIGDRL